MLEIKLQHLEQKRIAQKEPKWKLEETCKEQDQIERDDRAETIQSRQEEDVTEINDKSEEHLEIR